MDRSSNTYTEVTESRSGAKAGPCQQLCGAMCCSMIGFVCFWGFLYGIATNEQRNVCTQRALDAAGYEVVHLDCTGYHAPEAGKPSHLSCPLTEASIPMWKASSFSDAHWLDGAFATKAVKVKQDVSMFQCKEQQHDRKEKRGDKEVTVTSWTYSMGWHDSHIDSGRFKAYSVASAKDALHSGCGYSFKGNPAFPMNGQLHSAKSMIAGVYDLTKYLDRIYADTPISLDSSKTYWLPRSFPQRSGNTAQVNGNFVDSCPGAPEIGCIRISYYRSTATEVSFLGTVKNKRASLWRAPPSWMCKSDYGSAQVELFGVGEQSAGQLLTTAARQNSWWTWILRVGLTILVILSIRWFFEPIQTIANLVDQFFDWFNFIPVLGWLTDFLGNVVAGATRFVIWLIALGLGLPSSLFVLALAWLVMRPLFGIPVFVGAAALLYFTIKKMNECAQEGTRKRHEEKKEKAL